jgi:putative FmdB family regulatory protein
MPIYEYICQDCGKQFETIVSFSAARDTIACKYCNSTKTKKTMSATSFRVGSSAGSVSMGSGPSGGGCASGSGFR